MLKEYYEKIVQWGKDRKIIPNAKILVQAGKMVSEKAEISKAFLETDYIGVIDGIGDTFVTLVNVAELCKLKGIDQNLKLEFDEKTIENSAAKVILELDVLVGEILDHIIKENYTQAYKKLNNVIQYLHLLAILFNTTLVNCVEHSYNQIKDRKGITLENGTFIKESDPRYKEIIEQNNSKENIQNKEEKKEENSQNKEENSQETNQNKLNINKKIKKFKKK